MKAWLILVALALAPVALAGPAQEIAAQARAAAQAKRHPEALLLYQKVLDMRPESPEALYNFGTALYRTEDYERALDHFERAAQLAGRGKLAARARYNAGNSAFYFGLALASKDPGSALGMMEHALDAYREALRLDGALKDASQNAEIVKKWLRLLEEHFAQQQAMAASASAGPPMEAPGNAMDAILGQERQARNRPGPGARSPGHRVDKDW